MTSQPPVFEENFVSQLLADTPPALVVVSIPVAFTYLSIWLLVKRWVWLSRSLILPTLTLFWVGADVAPVRCRALQAQYNFGVAIAAMKLLDIHALSLTKSFPSYTAGKPPRSSLMALILLTELRYESFTPNPIRYWKIPAYPFPSSLENRQVFYSEPVQLVIHLILFIILQCMPQQILPIKSLGILFAIWLLWTSLERILRYRTSPPLFGPIYLADSLTTFWTETWHNALAAPCLSLAYAPTTYVLTRLGLPRTIVRSCAVVASFGLMGSFHQYAMVPILSGEGHKRIGIFFLANGVCTVSEVAIWGKKRHWVRAVFAWVIELGLASWTVAECQVADGLLNADWRGLCRAKV